MEKAKLRPPGVSYYTDGDKATRWLCIGVFVCVFTDLQGALFDLVARGVESRGLLEEELSGCLQRLRGRNRDDQMSIVHTLSHSEISTELNNTLIMETHVSKVTPYFL